MVVKATLPTLSAAPMKGIGELFPNYFFLELVGQS